MRICQTHWKQIRERIKALGIDHLGAKSGQEAVDQAVRQIHGMDDPKSFDPLMSCNWMITGKAIELAGLQIMTPKEDGTERCPICEAWEHRHDGRAPGEEPVTLGMFEAFWLDGPTNAALQECRELGLVPKQQ